MQLVSLYSAQLLLKFLEGKHYNQEGNVGFFMLHVTVTLDKAEQETLASTQL